MTRSVLCGYPVSTRAATSSSCAHTAHLLARLCSGRDSGPVFLASRRPRAPVATADRDPATGRARLSYRRAAEAFTGTTGWTLHQLRHTRIRELKDHGCPLPVLQKITGHRSLRTLTEHCPDPPRMRYAPGMTAATRSPAAGRPAGAEQRLRLNPVSRGRARFRLIRRCCGCQMLSLVSDSPRCPGRLVRRPACSTGR